ncbi:asparagine synthase (glutamine-hydrolyzing) [Halorubrum ezzemoulense]|uniref:asparagine synthase (glutamine-hydrolyzing) n=1 Tax=Halorubrum ezzemoulense TaxID=337243 RepID=UPI0023300C71|nr:asparagine synthase (glutamine-hydrolyzing) [Halorubrum ezzemoulense]MDB2248612.1 asparagine synthase (glutamine-hydrolyzing) [Halorubrum ezzemoulense]
MCGISGLYSTIESPGSDVLEQMNSCVEYRGPDESGYFQDGPIGFAHRRLSIVGLDTGRQPIFNENNSVCVIFNGEIYNHRELRQQLSAHHTFTTDTDTEILVHLYEEHGPSFVDHLRGMFAFALWDTNEQRLLLARDRMGIKPLLFADDGEGVAFSSELPALLESGVDHGGIDKHAVSEYFAFGHIPAPRTIFQNARKLRPGELAIVDEDGLRREQFYTPSVKFRDVSFEEATNELRTRIDDAVNRRLMSDVPLGAFLSGGIDSSIVVGTMADLMDEPVRTFTVGFDQSLFDESWAAREVADYHETDHTEFTVTADEVRDAIPTVLDRLGEPFADQSLIPTYIVSRETSQDVKVALSGDGADELFAGYSKYRGEYYSEYYRQLPKSLRSKLIAPAVNKLDASRSNQRGEVVRKAQKFLRGDSEDIASRHFEWNRILNNNTPVAFSVDDPAEIGRERLRQEHQQATAVLPPNRQDDMSRILTVDTQFGLPNQILHKTDLASMYNSLEVRVPFLDTGVVEYAMSLPTQYKITRREQKRVLKSTFNDRLPEAILDRDKQGFDMPIGEWFKNELATEFEETISELETGLFDTDDVLDVFENHRTGSDEHGKFLWSVYVFARWHRRMKEQGVL